MTCGVYSKKGKFRRSGISLPDTVGHMTKVLLVWRIVRQKCLSYQKSLVGQAPRA
jgi:hypothetical protein